MALLERVTTLIKANINDLVDKAENPEKLLKQLLLDMQNQFMQVKTQVAMAIADQHMLEKKHQENVDLQKQWVEKAELALRQNEEALARTALERSLTYETAARNFAQQLEDQLRQVTVLREAMRKLEQKMNDTKSQADVLIAQHRRARSAQQLGAATIAEWQHEGTFNRLREKVSAAESLGHGYLAASQSSPETVLADLEKNDKVERLLNELKAKTTGLVK
ncbi:MAG TPA: PspA/IM30 family protein [Bryobacteraceae bacterium]|nr:PspA/IM30 family protein [Bryobacteraceae bacterium]